MGAKNVFESYILAKRDIFGSMKDAGIFWVIFQKISNAIFRCKNTEIFWFAKKSRLADVVCTVGKTSATRSPV